MLNKVKYLRKGERRYLPEPVEGRKGEKMRKEKERYKIIESRIKQTSNNSFLHKVIIKNAL